MWHASETTLTFSVMYLFPLTSEVYLLVNLFFKIMLPLDLSGLLSYSVGIKRRTSRRVTCKRDNSHFLRYVLTLKPKSCAGHNSHTV